MSSADLIEQFSTSIASGSIKVIDLSHPLGPETPVIVVPEGPRRDQVGPRKKGALGRPFLFPDQIQLHWCSRTIGWL